MYFQLKYDFSIYWKQNEAQQPGQMYNDKKYTSCWTTDGYFSCAIMSSYLILIVSFLVFYTTFVIKWRQRSIFVPSLMLLKVHVVTIP